MAGNIHIDLSEEIECDLLQIYQSLCDDLTQKLNSMEQKLEELCMDTQFEPMVNVVNDTVTLFNEEIYSVADQAFEEWRDGNGSFSAASENSQAGDEAMETARQIEQRIRDIFDEFWSSHPMGEGIWLDISWPKIKDEDFDELKEIYTKFFQDVESIGDEVINQIVELRSDNPTYNVIIPAVKAITEPMKNAFEQFCTKIDEAKEDSETLKQQQEQTAVWVETESCVEKNEIVSCRYCGAEMLSNTKFCIKCGKNNDKEIQKNTKLIKTEAREQANNKPLIVAISIITAVIVIAIIALIVIYLPPSKRNIELDALEYANLDSAYTVSDIAISIKNQNNSYLANVQIDAVNKDNDDTNYIQLYINYSRNGLKYDKSLSGVVESSVYPNHNPDENDVFPLPNILFEIQDSGETLKSSVAEEGITIDIDYEHIIIKEKTAEVPLTIGVDYANVKGESTVTVQYMYEGDYTWSGENEVTVDLQQKNTISEELVSEDIKNNTFPYNGYINEELHGTYMVLEELSVQYYDLYNRAEVETIFSWQNENVKLTGNLLLLYDYEDDQWELSSGQIDINSVKAEWLYSIKEETLAEQLNEIIVNNCAENNEISNIEIVTINDNGDGKTTVTVNYNSVQQPFLFKNVIELDYNATVFQGYQLGDIREISTDYVGIYGEMDKDISVNYSTYVDGATPNGMSLSGISTLHLHIDESGEVHLSGNIGTISLDNTGVIVYPTGELSLSTCEKVINVNYVMIFQCDADISYIITPSLTYCDNKLSGKIYCKSRAIGVDDFFVVIE